MSRLSAVLDVYLAARGIVHGVLMDILGLGVLVIGESGIGKSECALDLVVRGHRLVADDAVELRCRGAVVRAGQLPRADAASHGDPRARPDQRAGPVRGRLDAHVEARRAGRAARALGAGPRVRSARPRRQVLRAARRPRADDAHAGGARAATSRSWWKSPRATSCCGPAGTTRRGASSSGSTGRSELRTPPTANRSRTTERSASDARRGGRRRAAPPGRP